MLPGTRLLLLLLPGTEAGRSLPRPPPPSRSLLFSSSLLPGNYFRSVGVTFEAACDAGGLREGVESEEISPLTGETV